MYTVTWSQFALDSLAATWIGLSPDDRRQLSESVRLTDLHLRQNAPRVGESRVGKARILFVEKLGLEFNIEELDRRVEVFRVWLIRK